MDVTPLVREGAQIIQSYAGGKFRVSGKIYEGAIIVTPDSTTAWSATSLVSAEDFILLADKRNELDVVLLGTGKTMQILDPGLRKVLKEMGLAVESMDTGAACRTYNVLMAEGRRVAASLLPT